MNNRPGRYVFLPSRQDDKARPIRRKNERSKRESFDERESSGLSFANWSARNIAGIENGLSLRPSSNESLLLK